MVSPSPVVFFGSAVWVCMGVEVSPCVFVVSVVGSGVGLVFVLVFLAGVLFVEGGIVDTNCSCVVVHSGVVVVAVSRSGVDWACSGVSEGARFGLLMYSTSLFTSSSSRLFGLLLLLR